ncbi:FIST C-terminal domain-containing protein [Alteromonas sp. IB21]|uniref:FIST signal transduction protein n=1 Tax=Alteromonas sp. IB21 TaxID=2779369 RepID=UPI0018E7A472|nr:FIST C-terminal domain-containing protein [Alteromonas sp. IB21]MBJ2128742.1 FIST C-terminal domain-containing protein [Alteromonas sp. IB21]
MQIETFEIQCADTAELGTHVSAIFEKREPSLVIGYGNSQLPFAEIQASLTPYQFPFLVSSSCLGSLLCDSQTVKANCDLAFFCVFDDEGAYGVGSASLIEDSPFKGGANALLSALESAGRPYESPALIWCALPPGEEERILEGFASVVGENVPIFGGSMADNTVQGNWNTVTLDTMGPQTLAVVAMYPSTPLGLSYSSGYKPTDTEFCVSKAHGRQLMELDGIPASYAYNSATNNLIEKQVNGGQILGLTSSAPLGRPVALENGAINYLLCHPDSVNENGALNVFSEVKENDSLVLMEGSIASLTSRAQRVINNAIMLLPENRKPVGVLMIYCAGCRLMVGDEIKQMLFSLQKEFASLPICGPFTFGEQGRFLDGKNRHGNLMISAIVFSQ